MPMSAERVRSDMPVLKELVYLDSASVVPAPVPVMRAMEEYLHQLDRLGDIAVASGAQGSLLAITPKGVRSIVRTSVHYCNTRADIAALGDALRRLVGR